MRGKHRSRADRRDVYGITPAHAGKTQTGVRVPFQRRDHPRACGENVFARHSGISGVGSPPRMRGKQLRLLHADVRYGITPAHAGKTAVDAAAARNSMDHPRACGENGVARAFQPVRKGSPPRMRGKHYRARRARQRSGITPAHAGKTAQP